MEKENPLFTCSSQMLVHENSLQILSMGKIKHQTTKKINNRNGIIVQHHITHNIILSNKN